MENILLFSGGKESLYQLHFKQKEIGLLLHFNYGHKSYPNELKSLEYYSKLYNIPYEVIELPFFNLPPSIKEGIDCNPYVAQRNLVFASIAMHLAESRGMKGVYLGAVSDAIDYDGHPYFIDDFNNLQVDTSVKLKSISRKYSTATILRSLIKNKVDVSHLWTCDSDITENGKFCGSCAKCTNALHNYQNHHKGDPYIEKYYRLKYNSLLPIDKESCGIS